MTAEPPPVLRGVPLNLAALRDAAPAMAEAVLERVRVAAPAGEVPDPVTLRNLRLGAQHAVACFLARLEDGEQPLDVELFVAHGRAQQVAGRSLAELLAFYRLGGLVMWERTGELDAAAGLSGAQLFALGSLVLGLVDELSVAAVEGYTAARAETRRRDRARRERLLSLLRASEPRSAEELAAAGDAAGWPLPARVRVAVAALPASPEHDVVLAGPARVLAGAIEGGRCALVVGVDGEEEVWLSRAARALGLERPLVLGSSVAPARAAAALARAVTLHQHVAGAGVTVEDVVRVDEHEVGLLLLAEPDLAAGVASRLLGPLDARPAGQRARLLETLDAWLAYPGRPQAMADALGLHVQTVRYRIGRLRDVLGDALDDPEARFELALALRVRATQPAA